MNKEVIEYVILIIILFILLMSYFGYIIYDERKKTKYYKSTILYETKWDKYSDMIRVQKSIIIKKIMTLFLVL